MRKVYNTKKEDQWTFVSHKKPIRFNNVLLLRSIMLCKN